MKAKFQTQENFTLDNKCEKQLIKDQYEIYSIKDIMSLFGVTRRTISNWQSSGRLSYVKIGHLIYVTREQMSTFLNENTVVGYNVFGRRVS